MGLHISAARSRLHGAPSRLPPLLNSPLHPPAARPHGARTLSLHPPVPRAAYRMTLVFRRSDGGRGTGRGQGRIPGVAAVEDPHASLPLPAAAALSQPPSPPATSPPLCRPSSPGALARPSSVGCLAPSAARPSRPPGPRQGCKRILIEC